MGLALMTEPTRFLALAGRVLIGLIFLWGGVAKILTFDSTTALIAKAGLPFPNMAWLVSVVLEAGCGVLFVIGFQVRPAAVVLAIFCLITAFAFHSEFSNPLQIANFIKNFLIIGGLLNVAHFGAGPLSLDNRRASSEGQAIA
jgi:putative oxidoreductase